jgi:cadmium resistance transport/sequestration family protein
MVTEQLLRVVIAAVTSFVATNLDDILILMIFFSQKSDRFRPRHIVFGQYLGFIVLVLASLVGFLGGTIIPKNVIGLLGIVPIFIGVKQLFDAGKEEEEVQTISSVAKTGFIYSFFSSFVNPKALNVAAVTIANGGDNIGIYLSLFAASDPRELMLTILVFLILLGAWCWLAYQLTLHPVMAKILNRYGHKIAPWVLIGVGIYILVENKSYQLILNPLR